MYLHYNFTLQSSVQHASENDYMRGGRKLKQTWFYPDITGKTECTFVAYSTQ